MPRNASAACGLDHTAWPGSSLGLLLEELPGRFGNFQAAGSPERLASNLVSGYKHIPIAARLRTTGAVAG
jgi:hypothetical protein